MNNNKSIPEQNLSSIEHVAADGEIKDIAFIKPVKVIGKNVVFRNAVVADAKFILQLRTDPIKGKYLSATTADIDMQVAWLEKYAGDNSQIYFIIEDRNGERFGTIRLYDVIGDSFCWGSWILRDGRPSGFAMESALLVYQFALSLGFKNSHFDVRKENTSVWQFHERFGAERTGEQGEDYIYRISHDAILNSFEKYKKHMNDQLEVLA